MRLLRGLAALLVLVGLLAGAPLLLLAVTGPPVSRNWSVGGLWTQLTSPDDGSFLVSVLGLVGWVAWVVLLLSTLVEVLSLLRGRRLRLPGLGLPQHLVRSLLLTVLAMAVAPSALADASPSAPGPVAAGPVTVAPAHAAPSAAPREREVGAGDVVHEVVPGDDLWSLAERYYGEGTRWRRIAEANPDRLTGGADHLETGWRLVLPGAVDPPSPEPRTVTVVAGDTLSGLAGRHLGDPERWPELAEANTDVLADPDRLPVGAVLALPAATTGSDDRAAAEARSRTEQDRRRAEQARREHESRLREDAQQRRQDRSAHPAGDGAAAPDDPSSSPHDRSGPAPQDPAPDGQEVPVRAETPEQLDELARIGILGSTGGLLAAALVGGMARRRAVQLATRPPGRQLPVPSAPARLVRSALGQHQQTLGSEQLRWVQHVVARHCSRLGVPVPPLDHVLVTPERISVVHQAAQLPPPHGFEASAGPGDGAGTWWITAGAWARVGRGAADDGAADDGAADDGAADDGAADDGAAGAGVAEGAPVAWPALVSLGRVGQGQILVCLQQLGLTSVLGRPAGVESAMSALMMELGCSRWAAELRTTLVGPAGVELAEATELATLEAVPELEPELQRLERRWAAQQAEHVDPGVRRLDADADTAWTPQVLLLSVRPTPEQTHRLQQLLGSGAPLAVVAADGDPEQASSVLRLSPDGLDARLERVARPPVPLVPQLVEADVRAAVLELMRSSGSTSTTPAPWWPAGAPSAPADDRTLVRLPVPAAVRKEPDAVTGPPAGAPPSRADPTVLLLGVVELVGARGPAPTRAAKQCVEYCAWLLEHPGRTAPAMASSLVVAEGTRRSNMSRLRRWLGEDEDGEPYLPDAYSGRISLHHGVGSDLDELRALVAGGVPNAQTEHLLAALRLVRGAPLADAAPGQWGWAEELRIEVLCTLRDVALVVTDRALAAGDLDLARWAAARGLTVSPEDERLLAARLRTEHRAGNQAEVERLALRLTRQAKLLEVDLDEQTVTLLQQVMEGRIRAREA